MIVLGLIWVAATTLVGKEFLEFFKDSAAPPDGDPGPTPQEPMSAAATAEAALTGDSRQPSDEQQVVAVDRAIALSGGALVLAAAGSVFTPWLRLMSLPVLVAALYPTARIEVRKAWAERRVRFQALEVGHTVIELAMGLLGLSASGWLVFSTGQRILLSTRREARSEFASAMSATTASVWLVRDGVEVEIPLERAVAGDLLVVRAGDSIPIDGHIVEGAIGVDQRALTGESTLRELGIGAPVRSATLVLSGHAIIHTERTGSDTVAARVEALIAGSTSYEQQLQARVTRLTDRSVRPTLLLAGYGLLTRGPVGVVGGLWSNALDIAWLSSPLSMRTTCQAAARLGILIKDGRSLELLGSVDTVIFDKTGTLTLDQFDIHAVHRIEPSMSEIDILRLAAALEGHQPHPIARAIVAAAGRDPRPLPAVEHCLHEIGYGVRGVVDDRPVALGSRRMMASEGITALPETAEFAELAELAGRSLIYLAIDGRLAGAVELAPSVRPEALELVQGLQRRGLDVMMLSGDEDGPARLLAASLGIPRCYSRTLPEEKGLIIDALQAEGRRVLFVGDGINDAIALHRATVSISIRGASAVAVDSAQILVQEDALARIPALFAIGAHYTADQRKIEGAAKLSTAVNVTGFLLAGFNLGAVVGIYLAGFGASLAIASMPRIRGYSQATTTPALADTPASGGPL